MSAAIVAKDTTGFGKRLRTIRREKGFTQETLGEVAGMRSQVIARLETGGRTPGWDTVIKLATALGVTPDAFLGDDDQAGQVEEPDPEPPPRRTGKK